MAPTQPCRYYAMGACTKGNSCTFLHQKSSDTNSGVCEFYLQGNCRFGSYCQLKHTKPKKPVQQAKIIPAAAVIKPVSVPVSVKKEEKIVLGLCPFQFKGECKYGSACKYVHGLQCPNCLKYCLDPRDDDQEHANHIKSCTTEKESNECTVCFETVQEKKDPRFGLLTCQHCVCLECIRTWRENSTSTAKMCPICRSTTYFVTPSTKWPNTEQEKHDMIEKYKEKLSQIDCRHYNKGNGTCPFSTSCFYRHVDEYGVKDSDKIRILSNSNFDDEGLKKACRDVHGLKCPYCEKNCLHPAAPESQIESHLLKCGTENYKKPECGICYEVIEEKNDPRYAILSCVHPFCLSCIRTWRSNDSGSAKTCPSCRTATHFVIPSKVWPITDTERETIVNEYKYSFSQCPFRENCYYKHTDQSMNDVRLPINEHSVSLLNGALRDMLQLNGTDEGAAGRRRMFERDLAPLAEIMDQMARTGILSDGLSLEEIIMGDFDFEESDEDSYFDVTDADSILSLD
ncbi:hypothetical protein HK103_006775 [Boothiomyces macroporosus]|uniref:RING-type E3 ubiquitin transferase n=1 Tax=Boothiomyces macroporosus TaxID=261099 RepID=A0AAD5Y6F0_9FUNG|nr:hypothetical protein HK103_006775 [Boothiomyces macroporosus]